jgi:hypothetical protein
LVWRLSPSHALKVSGNPLAIFLGISYRDVLAIIFPVFNSGFSLFVFHHLSPNSAATSGSRLGFNLLPLSLAKRKALSSNDSRALNRRSLSTGVSGGGLTASVPIPYLYTATSTLPDLRHS